ncbi:MAG TPA: hypothetical protein VKA97_00925, partial [Pyrinomonadaceae bacterium]|nr:hypothetical protein [Pyrinomonadaceae bacterium]
PQRKALLRCLIEKVVPRRTARDQVQVRIVWRGGDTTTMLVPVQVKSLAALSSADEMKRLVIEMTNDGISDEQIAEDLTQQGYRSPMRHQLLPSTVRSIRLKQGLMRQRSQSHPRRIAGRLTVPQLARRLDVSAHWI